MTCSYDTTVGTHEHQIIFSHQCKQFKRSCGKFLLNSNESQRVCHVTR